MSTARNEYNRGMRSTRPVLLSLALLSLTLPAFAKTAQPKPPVPSARPELRAFWVDGFNDGFKSPAQCDLLLHRLRADHCNAVFVQMRKRADAYYASHYEGWAQDDPDHFDALQYLCDHAHAPGKPAHSGPRLDQRLRRRGQRQRGGADEAAPGVAVAVGHGRGL